MAGDVILTNWPESLPLLGLTIIENCGSFSPQGFGICSSVEKGDIRGYDECGLISSMFGGWFGSIGLSTVDCLLFL